MRDRGELAKRPYVQLTVKTLFGADAPWCAAGIGRHQADLNQWAAQAGGHLRTRLEDNIRLDNNTLAPSNAALVQRAVEYAQQAGRTVAMVAQAREILDLPAT